MAESDLSGLISSACALASAAASAPMLSLERGMAGLPTRKLKADRPGPRPLGPDPMAKRLSGVLGHELLQLCSCVLVLEMGGAGSAVHGRKLGPSIGRAHLHNPDCSR